jgi:dipeptidyl aminopeptidase/acylaminoacyl peptidase
MRILPLLAIVSLPGCDSTPEWLRASATAAGYAAPLANDTSVVTVRRVWSEAPTPGSTLSLHVSTMMPDGTGIAATDWQTRNPAVFDLASREFHTFRLNNEPYDAGTALQTVASPDGSRILFVWIPADGSERHLRVVDVATGESRMIMAPDSAAPYVWPLAWSPAGDSVFAMIWPRELHSSMLVLIPVSGGAPRTLHAISSRRGFGRVSPSPDGRWLVYEHRLSRNQQARSDLYIIDVQGGGAHALVEHPGLDELVGWLPGTDVLLFSSDRSGTKDLWSVRVVNGRAGAEPRLVRSGFFRSAAVGFADGALFYTVRTGAYGQAVINVDPRSGALLGAASAPLEHLNTTPRSQAWSPDGQTLAAPSGMTINLHSMETGDSRMYWLDEDVHALSAEWAADGKSLLLRVARAGMLPMDPHHFLRLDLVTGTTTRLFAAAEPVGRSSIWRFLVTPDARSIILRKQHPLEDGRTGMKLVLRSLEDGSERELYSTPGFVPDFSLSTDGARLAFVQQIWEKADSLFVMRLDGAQPRRSIATWAYDAISLLGWLPGGNALLAARLTEDGTGEEILRIGLDGSITVVGLSPFRPMRGRPVQGYNRTRLVLSPAGNRLAHHVIAAGEELWRMDGLHELFARDGSGRR